MIVAVVLAAAVVAGCGGGSTLAVKDVGIAGGLSRDEVLAMMRDGWEIDAHTISHGYYDATTTTAGIATHTGDPFALPRVRVTPPMTAADLLAILRELHAT